MTLSLYNYDEVLILYSCTSVLPFTQRFVGCCGHKASLVQRIITLIISYHTSLGVNNKICKKICYVRIFSILYTYKITILSFSWQLKPRKDTSWLIVGHCSWRTARISVSNYGNRGPPPPPHASLHQSETMVTHQLVHRRRVLLVLLIFC